MERIENSKLWHNIKVYYKFMQCSKKFKRYSSLKRKLLKKGWSSSEKIN